jgi:predicted acyltransferase
LAGCKNFWCGACFAAFAHFRFQSFRIARCFAADWYFQVIKKIWTSSFMLVTSGWAFLVFVLLYWLFEIKKWNYGTKPWFIFGSNAIAIYVLADVFETLFLKSGVRVLAMNTMQNMDFILKLHLSSGQFFH